MMATTSNSMDRKTAADIVARYRAVLEETAAMVSGVPESKLPCDQATVKQAIETVLTHTSKLAEEYMNLQEAFCKLALFIPDEDARMVELAEQAIATMDPNSEGFKFLGKLAAAQEQIQNAFAELTAELIAWGKTQADVVE
jgi:hypothetical protein